MNTVVSWSCNCDGYVAAFAAGGFFSLAALFLALAAGSVIRTRKRVGVTFGVSAILASIGGIAFDHFERIERYRGLIGPEKYSSPEWVEGQAEATAAYLSAIPGQMLFNISVLVLVGLFAFAIASLSSRIRPTTSQ